MDEMIDSGKSTAIIAVLMTIAICSIPALLLYLIIVNPYGGTLKFSDEIFAIFLLIYGPPLVIYILLWKDISYFHIVRLRKNELILENWITKRREIIPYRKISEVNSFEEARGGLYMFYYIRVVEFNHDSIISRLLWTDFSEEKMDDFIEDVRKKMGGPRK